MAEFSHEKWWFSIATLNYQRVEGARKCDGWPSLSQLDGRKTNAFWSWETPIIHIAGYACNYIPFHPHFAPLPVSLMFAETTIFKFVLGVVPIHIQYPSLSIPSKYPISPQPQKPIKKNPHLNIPFPYEIHWNPDINHHHDFISSSSLASSFQWKFQDPIDGGT